MFSWCYRSAHILLADLYPELVSSVRERGHEIASKGYQHRPIREMSRGELAEDLQRAREAIERACGQRIVGCRVSDWLTPRDAWALEVMAEQGYLYDSSMRPMLRSHADERASRHAHLHRTEEFFQRYGGMTVVISRFMPIIRTFAPFVAGIGHMHVGRFQLFNIVGGASWVLLFMVPPVRRWPARIVGDR